MFSGFIYKMFISEQSSRLTQNDDRKKSRAKLQQNFGGELESFNEVAKSNRKPCSTRDCQVIADLGTSRARGPLTLQLRTTLLVVWAPELLLWTTVVVNYISPLTFCRRQATLF